MKFSLGVVATFRYALWKWVRGRKRAWSSRELLHQEPLQRGLWRGGGELQHLQQELGWELFQQGILPRTYSQGRLWEHLQWDTFFSWAVYYSIFGESAKNIFAGVVFKSIIKGGVYESFFSGTLLRTLSQGSSMRSPSMWESSRTPPARGSSQQSLWSPTSGTSHHGVHGRGIVWDQWEAASAAGANGIVRDHP